MKNVSVLLALFVLSLIACDPNRNKATISKDTTGMNHGGPTILDTAKRDKVQKDSALKKDTNSTDHSKD